MSGFFSCPSISGRTQNASAFSLNFAQSMMADTTSGDQHQKKEEIDKMLSEALSRLTFEERRKEQESVHGVIEKVQEEETFIENCLQELDHHLSTLKKGSVYEAAEIMDPSYVRAREFRIMFLRGNRYDAQAAAHQMILFFKAKQRLF